MAKVDSRPVVVNNADKVSSSNDRSRRLSRIIPALLFSVVVNVLLLLLLLIVPSFTSAQTETSTDPATFDTKVADNEQESVGPNLENTDLGKNDKLENNNDSNRIEAVTVPGEVRAEQQVGIPDRPEGPPENVPPPVGIGAGARGGQGPEEMVRAGTGPLPGPMVGGGLRDAPGGFGARGQSGATRMRQVEEGGGNALSEAAVARALKWFEVHQHRDGHWSLTTFHKDGKCRCHLIGNKSTLGDRDNDVAATAFGLLPLLGAGQTHKGGADKGNRYVKVVESGLRFLNLQQDPNTGAFNNNMYAHGLATIAACEAFALTSDPALRGPCQKAVNFILNSQNDQGSWRYHPKDTPGDLSVTGWQVMALKSAQMAGLDVPTPALLKSMAYLDTVGNGNKSQYGYQFSKQEQLSANRTAIGLLCRQYLGWGPQNPSLIEGVNYLSETAPSKNNMYYNYYATQVMHHMGGPAWDSWNVRLRDHLIKTQKQDASGHNNQDVGSWYNMEKVRDPWCSLGGRVMETSLATLTLEVYYRHLPLYRRNVEGDKGLKAPQ